MKGRYAFWVGLLVVVSLTANAQTSVTPESEYKKLINVDQNIQPLGANPFGENISLYDGTLSFEQTDVTIPGTGPALQLGRLFVIQDHPSYTLNALRPFGDWELDIPRIETFAGSANATAAPIWQVQGGSTARCSSFGVPPVYSQQGYDPWTPSQWWYGYHLMIPGQGSQNLLSRNSQTNTLSPSISGLTFPIVTKQNWMIHCGVTASDGGEGFVAIAPDGTQYTFAYLIYRPMTTITSPYGTTPAAVSSKVGVTPQVSQNNILFRRDALMMVTKVQDRFGNTLTYNYTGNNLTSIVASDGRQLTFQYGNTSAGQLVTSVTATAANASPRVWTYTYDTTSTSQSPTLTGLALPDASTWSFNLGSLEAPETYTEGGDCTGDVYATLDPGSASGSMTHPSGLTGTFVTKAMMHGRSYVPKQCFTLGTATTPTYSTYPEVFYQYSIVSKQFSGAGLPTRTWTYNYSAPNQSWSTAACASDNTCATTVYTDVVDPEGNDVRTTFSNRYDSTEGLLLQTDYFTSSNTSAILRSVVNSYASPTGGPWPTAYGFDLQDRNNRLQTTELSPLSQRVTSDNGDTYTWLAEAFNAYAQVTKTKRYNSIGYQQAFEEQTSYLNDPTYWVLGLPQEIDNLSTGETESVTTYTAIDTPLSRSRFGQTLMNYTFNSAGQLASFTDGNNHTTSLSDYYRGIPQLISYPDQTSESLVVDDFGQISSITDQASNTTSYAYDGVGRVTQINYPANDTVAWLPKNFTYSFVTSAERGIAANHWKRTITQGNYNEVSYYDAEFHPLLDDTSITGTANSDISTGYAYDWQGQTTFASYPVSGAPDLSAITSGMHSTYDALERPTQSTQDSELGTLTTTTAYTAAAHKVVTDPNGNVTTTFYQVFDQPSYDTPISVVAPTGIQQNISRDLYGNPTVIYQGGTYNGQNVSLSRYLAYDSYHRLCRTFEPESNSTVYSYDGANNIAWLATGQSISGDGTVCGTDQVPTSAMTTRTYDAMNRVTAENPPAGTQSTTYQYDPTGRLTTTISGIVIQGRTYNKLGLLSGESQWFPNDNNFVRSITYGYDAYGHLSTTTYPDGGVFGTFPDARGRATLVQGGSTLYASNISYYPDGGTAGYSLNNGITATIQRNTRQLPSSITYNQGGNQRFSEAYVYDADANLTTVTDLVNGQNNQTLGYDGLSRLTSAVAPNNWGTESFTYDPLNNIRIHVAAGLTLSFNYDATNRLATETQGTPTGSGFATFQYDERGNQTQSNVVFTSTPHTFDAKNQMLQVPGVATYSYDEAGRRIKKVLANGQVSYFFYSQAGQLMHEYDASTGQPTDYLYLNGKLIARYLAGQNPTYLLTDRLGTPVRETDVNGAVTQSFSYRPFGQLYSGPSQQQPGYTGHVFDPESSLSYMQARYQDGGLGQFLSVDPAGPTPGDVFSFNRYAYASNNPITHTDPDGRQVFGSAEQAVFDNSDAQANTAVMLMCGCDSYYKNLSGSGAVQSVSTPMEFGLASGLSELVSGGLSFFTKLAATASADFGSSTSISTFRMTTPGETFFHYSQASYADSFAGGLRPGGYATSMGNLSGAEAQSGLALPHANAPNAVYTVTPESGTWVNVNPVAQPLNGQPGGLPEWQFPNGTGPGTVSSPRMLNDSN